MPHDPTPARTLLAWRWLRFADFDPPTLYEVLALRQQVFILEQGPYLDADGLDQQAWHLLGRDASGALRAYLRVVDPGHKYPEPSIGRVLTIAAQRGTGLGHALMAEAVAGLARHWPGRANRISAQAHLQRYYGAHGYRPVGEPYLEDGIPHIEMLRPASP